MPKNKAGAVASQSVQLASNLSPNFVRRVRVMVYGIVKRFFDFFIAATSIILLSPILLIVAIAIKLDSPGPALFRQQRTGKNGKIFNMYKFRSMSADNDVKDASCEDKYTKVGRFIRKTSLDELPQFFNILLGQMSFIGPRPWIPDYYKYMNDTQRARNSVRPGITGLAAAKGRNGLTIFEKIAYDLEYVNNFSLLQDLKVIFLTARQVLSGSDVNAGKSGIHSELADLKRANKAKITKKVLMIAPKTDTFVNFRGDLIKDIRKKGYDVTVIIPENECQSFFKKNNIKVRLIDLNKNSLSVFNTVSYYKNLKKIIKEENPNKVFSYTIKPVIFGSIAAKKAGVKEIYSLICGLGLLFCSNSLKIKIIRFSVGFLYKYALHYNTKVIFQNKDDIDEFVKRKYVKRSQCKLVNGSGVNLEKFQRNNLPKNKVSFIMVSRVLKEKGVLEYFEAAKTVKKDYPKTEFVYIGAIDKNKNAINLEILEPYIKTKTVKYIPETNKVNKYIENSSVFVLPSYYREGIPKTLLEATAMGRPIITTNTPGCRETVVEKKNGVFTKPKDSSDLAKKMIFMIENKKNLQKWGNESYKLCTKKFTIDIINKDMMKVMNI